MRRLSSLVRRDPAFEKQVKAVAMALCKQVHTRTYHDEHDKVLSGDEVVAIMEQV
jgi:hypothetical protein